MLLFPLFQILTFKLLHPVLVVCEYGIVRKVNVYYSCIKQSKVSTEGKYKITRSDPKMSMFCNCIDLFIQ